jgi:hypothetical protein
VLAVPRGDASGVNAVKFHPISEAFPLIEGEEFQKLADDIRQNGLQNPIALLDSMILDGRNRYLAAIKAGFRPEELRYIAYGDEAAYEAVYDLDTHNESGFKNRRAHVLVDLGDRYLEFDAPYEGELTDPIAFAVSLNERRRHMSDNQRALVAAKLANLGEGRPSKTPPIGGVSQSQAGKLMNVSHRRVERASAVLKHNDPDMIDAVSRGDLALSTAEEAVARARKAEKSAVQDVEQAVITEEPVEITHSKPRRSAGVRIKLPPGFDSLEAVGRRVAELSKLGVGLEEMAKDYHINDQTLSKIRDVVAIADRNDLSAGETETAKAAVALLNDRGQAAPAYQMIEPIAKRLWGQSRRRTGTDELEAERVRKFDRAYTSIVTTCSVAENLEIPQLTQERAKECLKELNKAVSQLKSLTRAISRITQ